MDTASLRLSAAPRDRPAAARHRVRVAMSASLNWIAWKLAIGWPNCLRTLEYLIASSSAAGRCRSPGTTRRCGREFRIEPPSGNRPAIHRSCSPSAPSTSMNVISRVSEALIPHFFSGFARCITSGTHRIDHETGNPLAPSSGSVLANTINTPAIHGIGHKRLRAVEE